MALPVLDAVRSVRDHVISHPDALVKLAMYNLRRQVAIPLDALRWVFEQLPPGGGKPESLTITAAPPALKLDATVEFMGNRMKVAAAIHVDGLRLAGDEVRLVMRLKDVKATALTANTPIAQVLSSGAFDFSKPANLLNFAPKRPPVIVEAKDDRFELDLMKIPQIKKNPLLRRAIAAASPILDVTTIRTEGDWLLIGWRPILSGLPRAIAAARS